MRKLLFILFISIVAGCADRIELNDVAIVTGVSIDEGEQAKYRFTVEIVNSSVFAKQGGTNDAPAVIQSIEGNTIAEVSEKLNYAITGEAIFSHMRVVIIHENIAKNGMSDFLDYLERSNEYRNDFNILIAKKGKASDYLTYSYPTQTIPSVKINKQIEDFVNEWGGDPEVRLNDFITTINSKGKSAIAATISFLGAGDLGGTEDNGLISPPTVVVVDGVGIFKEDKLIGYLSLNQTRDYVWTQDLKRTTITVPCEESKQGKGDSYMGISITHSSTRKEVTFKNEAVKLKVKLYGEAKVEAFQCALDISNKDVYDQIEKKINQFIQENVENTIEYVQKEHGVDVFGFGEVLYRKNYKHFKKIEDEWHPFFRDGDVVVTTSYKLRRSGINTNSYFLEK